MLSQEQLERLQKEYDESGDKERKVFTNFLTTLYNRNRDNSKNADKKLENTLGVVYIHEKMWGVEGGSCWDGAEEDNTHEVHISEDRVVRNIAVEVNWIIRDQLKDLELNPEKVNKWIADNVSCRGKYSYIADYFQPEYYGNSNTVGIYKVDLNNLVDNICTAKEQEIYQEVKSNFTPPPVKKNKNWY